MAHVLTTATTIQCTHQVSIGITAAPPPAKLTVNGEPVLLAGGITLMPSCAAGQSTCTEATPTGGKAAKLTVGGVAVLVDTMTVVLKPLGTSEPPGTGKITKKQDRLTTEPAPPPAPQP